MTSRFTNKHYMMASELSASCVDAYFCAQETAMTPSFYAVHASISLDVVIAASILFCVRSAPLMQRQAVVWLLPAARWTSLVLKCKACQ